jgi:DNA topoisomerase-3
MEVILSNSTRLFIAEKPSMALEIARNLPGPLTRKDGYYETGDGIVTWLFGHVLQQAMPEEYDVKFKKWVLEDLPIIPDNWKLIESKSCQKQLKIVKKLIRECKLIIHAGDPDREGQLLVDEVLDYVKCRKKTQRLLLNALDSVSVRNALSNLEDNKKYSSLRDSALARQRADWLIGINMTRHYTLSAQRSGHKMTFPVGRVKTPTLALVVRRERAIGSFVPVDHFGIKATFNHANGPIHARWCPNEQLDGLDIDGRLTDHAVAKKYLDRFSKGGPARIVKAEAVKKSESAPLPLSLSALQIMAGKKFGYSPQVVLDTAQQLYEQKLTTYPRSDCNYLPMSQFDDAGSIIAALKNSGVPIYSLQRWVDVVNLSLKSQAWNDAKVTAHHAIIPTAVPADFSKLSEEAKNIYILISRSYVAQFMVSYDYLSLSIELSYVEEKFVAKGILVKQKGWKELFIESLEEPDDNADVDELVVLPAVKEKEEAQFSEAEICSKTTKPPRRFTQSTLLEAMRSIHKYVKDKTLASTLHDVSGIGTEATRASIIKELIEKGFLIEQKKLLSPTEAACVLIDALPDELTFPDTTAMWEKKLQEIVSGASITEFLDGQSQFVKFLCSQKATI